MQNSWIEIIKEKLTIREVIEHYCGKATRNKVKSPFNVEKTASLHIYDKTQKFRDFSSDSYGDIFDFVEKLFNCDIRQACKILINDFGVGLGSYSKLNKSEVNKIKIAREKKEQLKRLKTRQLSELRDIVLDYIKMVEQIKNGSKPYSLKNLARYSYTEDCNLHIWAIKNLERLNYLYSAISELQVEDIAKDLELVGFYAYNKNMQGKRTKQVLQNYLNGQLDLLI